MNKIIMSTMADLIESLPPERFTMSTWTGLWWYEQTGDGKEFRCEPEMIPTLSINKCNTAGCIAGWAVAMVNNMDASNVKKTSSIYDEGRDALGLTLEEASLLFYYDEDSIWFQNRKELGIKTRCERDHYIDGCGVECPADLYIADDEITNHVAAKVLRGIVSGEYKLEKKVSQ